MKKQLLAFAIILLIFTADTFAQTFNSRDNYTGTWISNSSWQGGAAPAVTAIANNINIRGYITRDGDLNFAANNSDKAITIYDTLVVTGNMSFGNNSQNLVVRSGAVLIVLGNFTATNKIDLSNGGIFVVRGNLSLSSSGQDSYVGTGQLYVLGNISGSDAAVSARIASGNLATNHPNIFDFVNGNTTSLPVKIIDFSAKRTEGKILISWKSLSEKNFDYFTIERSHDFKNFTEIGKVKGKGNSGSILRYSFSDDSPLAVESYYRLKATDFDGTYEYHSIIKIPAPQNVAHEFSIYPNPLSGKNFKINASFDKGSLKIYNILGKMVFEGKIAAGNEYQLESILKPGLYIAIAETGKQKIQTKLTVR